MRRVSDPAHGADADLVEQFDTDEHDRHGTQFDGEGDEQQKHFNIGQHHGGSDDDPHDRTACSDQHMKRGPGGRHPEKIPRDPGHKIQQQEAFGTQDRRNERAEDVQGKHIEKQMEEIVMLKQ